MLLAAICTLGIISAYFFRHITSDPIEGQQVQLSDYLYVFGYGLVFWLLVLLRAKLLLSGPQACIRNVAKLAIPITSITTFNLHECLRAPFIKLPLLVRFLVLLQVSSNLALLLHLCAVLSLKSIRKPRQRETERKRETDDRERVLDTEHDFYSSNQRETDDRERALVTEHDFYSYKLTDMYLILAAQITSALISFYSIPTPSSSSFHNISKINEMLLMLTAQTTGTLIGFHSIPNPSSSSKALLAVALMDQLVAYLCGLTSTWLSSNEPDSEAAKIFANIGLVCTTLGFILMVAMFVSWYFVLIVVLIFCVVWHIFFWEKLKTWATEVWNYLKKLRTWATKVWNYLKGKLKDVWNYLKGNI